MLPIGLSQARLCAQEEDVVDPFEIKFGQYVEYLNNNPRIAQADGFDYSSASPADRRMFHDFVMHLERRRGRLPPPSYPMLKEAEVWAQDPNQEIPAYFLIRQLAFSLWLEINQKVPWSLEDYDEEGLRLILSFKRPDIRNYYRIVVTADQAYRFWVNAGGKATSNRRQVIFAMAGWIRKNIGHRVNDEPGINAFEDYLDRTSACDDSNLNCIGSCHNNNYFMAAVGNALNIPVLETVYSGNMSAAGGHSFIDFPADDLALLHSDDLYSYGSLGGIPIEKIFITGQARQDFISQAALSGYSLDIGPQVADADRFFVLRKLNMLLRNSDARFLKASCGGKAGFVRYVKGIMDRRHLAEAGEFYEQNIRTLLSRARKQGHCGLASRHGNGIP